MPQTLSPSVHLPWLVPGDYEHALLHLAWLVEHGHYTLVFALVELFPSEMPPPDPTPEHCPAQPYRLSKKQSFRIYIKRHLLPAQAALAWYEASRAGTVVLPDDPDRNGDDRILATSQLAEDPPWPHLVATDSLPFLQHTWGIVRAHHLFQVTKPAELDLLIQTAAAIDWFSHQLFFDLGDYPEWLGSLHLIAPNPVFRHLNRHRETGAEHTNTVVRIIPRANRSLDSLHLDLTQYGATGLTVAYSRPLAGPETIVPHVGTVDTVGHRITCAIRGVLDWTAPLGYIDDVHLTIETPVAQRRVMVPPSPGRPGEVYDVPVLRTTYDNTVSDSPVPKTAGAYLVQSQLTRKLSAAQERRVEAWFYDERDRATLFVRDLITRARTQLWVVDPYFGGVDLMQFVMATTRDTVAVTIMTGADYLSKSDRPNTVADTADALLTQLSRLSTDDAPASRDALRDALLAGDAVLAHLGRLGIRRTVDEATEHGDTLLAYLDRLDPSGRITAYVMTGASPAVHDRFLVIDDAVWCLGNSLNTLGDRAGVIVQVANPEQIIAGLERIRHDPTLVVPLDTWVANRRTQRSQVSSSTYCSALTETAPSQAPGHGDAHP